MKKTAQDTIKGCKHDGSFIPIDEVERLMIDFAAQEVAEANKEINELLKSDSVATLLRFGIKSPSKSGMDDCEDSCYYDLYELSCKLRQPLPQPSQL